MRQDDFISLFLLAVLLWVVYILGKILLPFVTPLFWAAILAFAFYPVYRRLRPFFGSRESAAAGMMTVVILLGILPLAGAVLFQLGEETVNFARGLTDYVQSGALQRNVDSWLSSYPVRKFETRFFQLEEIGARLQDRLLESAGALGGFTAGKLLSLTRNVFITLFNAVLLVVILFFFIRDGEKIRGFFYGMLPLEEIHKREIARQLTDTLKSVIHGQLFIAFLQALLTGATFALLDLPFPILIGAVCFLFAVIPMLGVWLVWFPFAAYLALEQDYIRASLLFAIGILIVGTIDNLLYPVLIGKKTKLPYLLLLLSIMGGVSAYGVEGIFIGPGVLSLFFILARIYRYRFLSGQRLPAAA